MFSQWIRRAAAAAAVVLVAGAAGATTLTVTGSCIADCANLDLADGDPIGGTILVDDAYFEPNGLSGSDALEFYSFAFGNFSFTSDDPPDPGFVVSWGATPGSIAGFLVHAFVSDDPARPGPALILDTLLGGASLAAQSGFEFRTGCCIETGYTDAAELAVDAPAPIPLPAAGGLLGSGLLGLLAFGRRRGRV